MHPVVTMNFFIQKNDMLILLLCSTEKYTSMKVSKYRFLTFAWTFPAKRLHLWYFFPTGLMYLQKSDPQFLAVPRLFVEML